MKERMTWFHCYPEKWLDAIAVMKPDMAYLYLIICFRIYAKRGPIIDSVEMLSRRTGFRTNKVKRIIDELLSLGKLVRLQNGSLMNPFAEQEIAKGDKIAKRNAEIRSAAANKRWGKTETNQQTVNASAMQNDVELELDIDIEKKKEDRESPRPKRTRTRTAFPVGWCPEMHLLKYAFERGFTETQVALMFEAFGNHHTSRGNLMADWDAAWRTWVNNEIKFNANRRGNGNGRTVQDAAADLLKHVRKFDEPAPSDIRNGEGATVVRLLPQR